MVFENLARGNSTQFNTSKVMRTFCVSPISGTIVVRVFPNSPEPPSSTPMCIVFTLFPSPSFIISYRLYIMPVSVYFPMLIINVLNKAVVQMLFESTLPEMFL